MTKIMAKKEQFTAAIQSGYNFSSTSIVLGGAMLDGEAIPGLQIKVPLRTMTRHGLIAGATAQAKPKPSKPSRSNWPKMGCRAC